MSIIGAHQFLNYAYNTARYGNRFAKKLDKALVDSVNNVAKAGGGLLIGNQPINEIKAMGGIAEALVSPLDFGGRVYRGQGVKKAFEQAYMKNNVDKAGNIIKKEVLDDAGNVVKDKAGNAIMRNEKVMDWGNVAGTAVAGSLGIGIVGGLTHDTSGNVDIAGIPGI